MRRALVVVGLAFGDEGKGSVVDYLARAHDAHTVVLFNGGAQRGHNVVLSGGEHHTFSQFGSASFVAGVRTHMTRHALINPMLLVTEALELEQKGAQGPLERLTVDPDAPVTLPAHVALNRLRELARGEKRHGSCGLGIGETMVDVRAGRALRFRDLTAPDLEGRIVAITERKAALAATLEASVETRCGVEWVRAWRLLGAQAIADTLDVCRTVGRLVEARRFEWTHGVTIFEGSQGVLLDEVYGAEPYRTWSKTTPLNALETLAEWSGEVEVIGVLRAFATRHGAGLLPTQDDSLVDLMEGEHNTTNVWQGAFRVGALNLSAARYAASLARRDGGLDALAVTCVDRLRARERWPVLTQLARGTMEAVPSEAIPDVLADATGVPLTIASYGATADDKREMVVMR